MGKQMAVTHKQQVPAAVGLVHDMAGHQKRDAAFRQRVELFPEVCPQHWVQADCGFVEDQQIGLTDQRAGK